MAAPTLNPTAQAVYAWLGRAMTDPDPDNSHALGWMTEAATTSLDEVEQVTRGRDGRVGWQIAFDPDDTPAQLLTWLAQFVGVIVDPRWSVDATRAAIKDPSNWLRGTAAYLRAAAQPWLHRGHVRVIERADDDENAVGVEYFAGQLEVFTLDELDTDFATLDDLDDAFAHLDDVDGNAEELEAAVIAATPAWLTITVTQHPGALLDDIDAEFATLDELDAEFATLDEMAAHVPASIME